MVGLSCNIAITVLQQVSDFCALCFHNSDPLNSTGNVHFRKESFQLTESHTNQASTLRNTYIMNVVSKTATKRLSRFDLQPVTPNELGALSMIYKEGEFQFLRTTTTR